MILSIARLLAACAMVGASVSSSAEPNRDGLPTGWEWVFSPAPLGDDIHRYPRSMGGQDIVASIMPGPGQDVFVTITSQADTVASDAATTEYRAFLFDADDNPIKNGAGMMVGNGTLMAQTIRFEVDPDRFDRSNLSIGVARLTLDGRIEASLEALDEARAVGAKALPLPIVGRPYEFEMPTIDGGVIRSEDLRGKVVVIDSWATWCMPCMQKMPALKSLAEQHPEDLVVVGVNFDENLDDANAELAKGTVPGVQIHADTLAKGVDDLWYRATGIRSIPRIFVIDRDGILVHDLSPYQMEQRVEEVLATKAE